MLIAGGLTYIGEALNVVLMNQSLTVCKFYTVASNTLAQVSAWLTVAVAFQRTLCVVAPFKFTQMYGNSFKVAYISAAVICLVSLLLNITHSFAYKLVYVPYYRSTMCVPANKTFEQVIYYLRMVSYTFLTCLIPLVLIVVLSLTLLIKLSRSRFQTGANRERSRNITSLVVAIGIVYTISTLPWAIYLLTSIGWIKMDFTNVYIFFCASMSPVYYNNAINPWIYCVCGTGFRSDLQELLRSFNKYRVCCKPDDRQLSTIQTIHSIS